MFGFKKNKAQQPQEQASPPANPQGYSDVFVMPEKYIMETKKSGGKGLLIASIILIAVILLTASYLIYDMMNRPAAAPEVVPPQIEIIAPETQLPPENASTTVETASTTAEAATSTPTSTPATAAAAILPSIDSDNDGLTDIEETVLGTLPTNPDTDGDGYKDGVEVSGGYNPTKPGSSRLNESPFIASLTTAFAADNFKILYPKEWQVSAINASKQILITASTGEIIRISVKDNQLGQTALSFYLQDHPEALVSQLKVAEAWAGGLAGIYSPNGMTAYLTDAAKTKFYVFEYLIGQQTEFRYPTIFSSIIKSATLIAPPAPSAASSTPSVACSGFKCVEEPCGILANGQNSCLSAALRSTCYDRACAANSDCAAGQSCVEVSCWNGEVGEIDKVCK